MVEVKIKKGRHWSNWWLPKITFTNLLIGSVVFKDDFTYELNEDTNKLIGLSDNWHHHKDSIRLGWRVYKGKKEVMVNTFKIMKQVTTYTLCGKPFIIKL